MIELGQMNRLLVLAQLQDGWQLGHSEATDETVVLPFSDAPKQVKVGDSLSVFVYLTGEGELSATTARPKIMAGQLALLKAKNSTPYGMFMDWGMTKDLLVPNREQRDRMEVGESYLVYAYVDEQNRLAASSKYRRYMDQDRHAYQDGEQVHLTVTEQTPLGYNCIVDYKFSALMYSDQVFRKIKPGDQITGYIRRVREDGLLDVSTQQPGYGKVDDLSEKILKRLEQSSGELKLSDKSDPELIKSEFQCSKKAFKQALGALKKQGYIEIYPQKIVRK